MKYLFWIVLLVVTSVQATDREFYYEGNNYTSTFDFYDVYPYFWSDCRKQTVTWRMNRSEALKTKPYDYISNYISATSCDVTTLKTIVKELKTLYPLSDYQSVRYANFVTAYVNSYWYQKEKTQLEFGDEESSYQNPNETVWGSGDCEDLAILLTGLLSYSCIDTGFVVNENHAYTSCSINGAGGSFIEKNGKKYYVIEAVGGGGTKYSPWKVGQESDPIKGSYKHFTPVPKQCSGDVSKQQVSASRSQPQTLRIGDCDGTCDPGFKVGPDGCCVVSCPPGESYTNGRCQKIRTTTYTKREPGGNH